MSEAGDSKEVSGENKEQHADAKKLSVRKPFAIVVAATQKGGIGLEGKLPWRSIPSDMAVFKRITSSTLR